MRISELSTSSGVPVPTIKYYLREGLLPAGESTGRNQAVYGEGHLRRLRLVRALVGVGGLSIAVVGEIIAALDATVEVTHHVLGVVQRSIGPAAPPVVDRDADDEVAAFLARRGWEHMACDPSALALAGVVATANRLGHRRFADLLDGYADATAAIAKRDLDYLVLHSGPEEVVEDMVVATVLGDAALKALRRLAQRDTSAGLLREE
ncbi:MerR family transcriptional regulator [Umezawaea sp. Da 62-37]|uniref:MerR family transcriptional regulator n=1 Tax=Umezawaea sp. Da 62-37 TaxID=3075927 RepID=UPI0028F6E4CA|nr:MerR family transcriptional regulator [Umezawaea sp. Da 62-37]WNV83769.1 MerR family transcriptional regulator [Umezawaea sp. Da 62-37]